MIIEAPNQQFPNRKFQALFQLGKGAQGSVYLVKSINWGINDQKQFAIKQQANFNDNELQTLNMIIKYQNNQFNQASQVIKIYEICQYNNKVLLIMESGEQDLYKYIEQQQQLSLDSKIKIMKQLSQSIYFFHETLKLIHRDIKPENFIKVGDEFKLIDFGLAKTTQDLFMTQNVGTPQFQAPEIIQYKQDYTCAVDIWSLGCVFYELCKSQVLFQANTIQEIQNIVLNFNSKYLEDKLNQDEMPQSLKNLLIQMIQPNPKDRLSIKEVVNKLNQIQIEQSGNQNNNFIVQNGFQKNNQQFQQQNNFPQINQQIKFNPQMQQEKQQIQQQQQQQQQLKDQDQKQIEQTTLIQQIITILERSNTQEQFKNLQDQQDKYQQTITQQIQQLQNQFETNLNELKNEFKDQNNQQIKVQNCNNENFNKVIQEYQLNIKELKLKIKEQDIEIKELNQSLIQFQTKIQELNNQIHVSKDKEQAYQQLDQQNKELIKDIEQQQQMKQSQLQREIQDQKNLIENYEKNSKQYQEKLSELNQSINQYKSQEKILQNKIQENEKKIQEYQDFNQNQKMQLQQLNQIIQNSQQIKEQEDKSEILINKILLQLEKQDNQIQLQYNILSEKKCKENLQQNEKEKKIQDYQEIIQNQQVQLLKLNQIIADSKQIEELENQFGTQILKILDSLENQQNQKLIQLQQTIVTELKSIKINSQNQSGQNVYQEKLEELIQLNAQLQNTVQQQECQLQQKNIQIDIVRSETKRLLENLKKNSIQPQNINMHIRQSIAALIAQQIKDIQQIFQIIDEAKNQIVSFLQENKNHSINQDKGFASDLEYIKSQSSLLCDFLRKLKK
ncbi:unnamed protein product [Paramecium octaurelia]|uniref:Protein kinase domain-containing protein n=1 Tax=Paramecium octaurelia TaxID=43137 RepID=A0A8S1UDD1_PAROT|nr:unnamed protein product [Paramecium octaurelia]